MKRRCALRIVIATVALFVPLGAMQASAEPALLAIDNAAPTLKQEDDGDWSGTLGLTNLTDSALSLSAAPAEDGDTDCELQLSKAAIGAAQSSAPKLTIHKNCETNEGKFELTLTAAGAATQVVPVVADVQNGSGDPDWSQLAWFFYALPAVAGLLFGLFVVFGDYGVFQTMKYLEATYSFKESWVSNLTVVAGVLTGVFGSAEVVKAFLGEDADRSIALATVGSAIALIFIGSGPIILSAAKKEVPKKTSDDPLVQAFTVGGLLLATSVTMAGAFGQLWVGWKSGEALDLDGWEDKIVVGFCVAVALLAWYTLATVGGTLKAGTTPPPPAKPSELAQLIDHFKNAMENNDDVPNEAIPPVVEDALSYPTVGTSFGDEPYVPPRRRAAMP